MLKSAKGAILQQSTQESLANAKVSARQHCVYEDPYRRNLRQINARNIMLKSTFTGLQTLSLTIQVYLHSFSSCCLPNLRNPAKFSEHSNL